MNDCRKAASHHYRLRRIGLAATVAGVPDLLNLKKGVNRIGRHSQNDHFLDSEESKQLISRWHAEITFNACNNGDKYVIEDKSVNGTYVNDFKLLCSAILKEGDRVTFGHINGAAIQPGEYAEQNDSEFAFIFERTPDMLTTDISLAGPSPSNIKSEVKTEPDLLDSPVLSMVAPLDQQRNSQETPVTAAAASSASRKIFESPIGTVTVLKDIGNKSRSSPGKGLVHLDDLVNSRHCGPSNVTVDTMPVLNENDVFGAAISAANNFVPSTDEEDDSLPSFDSHFRSSINSNGMTHAAYTQGSVTNSYNTASTSQPVGSIKKRRGRPPQKLTATVNIHSDQSYVTQHQASGKRKREVKAQKKKAKKEKSVKRSSKTDDDAYHADGDICGSLDCKKPSQDTIDWVQCDYCEQWYHTVCAGCRMEEVMKPNFKYNCGCL